MSGETIDLLRLQKALMAEADRGFGDTQGKQYRFSEFLCLSLGGSPPRNIDRSLQQQWQILAGEFAAYRQLDLTQRRSLVARTRALLLLIQQGLQRENAPKETPPPPAISPRTPPPKDIPTDRLSLDLSLRLVRGIGPVRSRPLAKLNLYTVGDLLAYYPRDYLDYARQVPIAQLTPGETVTIVGTVRRCHCFTSPKNPKLTILEILLGDPSGLIKLSRFYAGNRYSNRGWQEKTKRTYERGRTIAASGLVKQNDYGFTLENPEMEVLENAGQGERSAIASLKIGRILPVYGLTEGVFADSLREAVLKVLPAAPLVSEAFPRRLREAYDLIPLKDALQQIHFPEDRDRLSQARRRLVFDEFFYLQLGFLRRRQQRKQEQGAVFTPQGQLSERFQTLLPFALTGAQQRVIAEILQDLRQPSPMNRLVQGDVGAGKTVVAVFAILAAIEAGYQAALMAPTEVLAEQHYRKLVGWFNLLHLPVELLTGSTKTKKRRETLQQLATGELPLLVGTHALIQEGVTFQRLGLVVIDEQHRFGVQQRAQLLAKGQAPHVLSMTATPIPRTLALTLHGDLEVSQLDELPPGRQDIETTIVTPKDRPAVWNLIKREVVQGRQAYIIFPLIEESEKSDLKAAVEEHILLSTQVFPQFQVGLLHGKMTSAEKEGAIAQFRDNQTQIIVSTTVIEVGVDVPNATVMVIEHAERFGLSQLHQLRGRVGRGSHQSYCLLMTGSRTPEAKQRLGVLEESTDGFWISEMDLRLRGPGEVLGTRQSGLPDFALASLTEDQAVLNQARRAAEIVLAGDPGLDRHPGIARELQRRYQHLWEGVVLT